MVKKLAGSKWLMTGLVIGTIIVVGLGFLGFKKVTNRTVAYCAEMSDGIGLFPGNAVTRRGVRIGTIRSVKSSDGVAKVTFDVESDQKLPIDAMATSIAPSIIAVRQLAIMGDDLGGAELPTGKCISRTRTNTPASISHALQSVSRLARELTVDGGPETQAIVMKSMNTIAREFEGVGPLINNLIKQLGVPARTPMAGALADMATALDHTSVLTTGLTDNWNILTQLVNGFHAITDTMVLPILAEMTRISYALPDTLVTLSSLVNRYSHFAWPALDAVVPMARLIGAGFRN